MRSNIYLITVTVQIISYVHAHILQIKASYFLCCEHQVLVILKALTVPCHF